MKTQLRRTLYMMLMAGTGAAFAQFAPEPMPAPPAPPAPVAMPARPAPAVRVAPRAMMAAQAAPTPKAAPAPAPALAPLPPEPPDLPDWQIFSDDWQDKVNDMAQRAAEKAMEAQDKAFEMQSKAWADAGQAFASSKAFNFNYDFDINLKGPLLAAQARGPMAFAKGRIGSTDGIYDRGRRQLDNREWDQAVTSFTDVAGRAGSRADAALYWKAYALNKLGRRDEALAAIAELRKSYASSRWLDDAAALEVEVKQSAGGTVAPDSTNDDEIKLLALNGLMQSDPDRAYPYLERLLKSPVAPRLKEQTLYVLAQSNTPKAQQALLQIAKGGGNPDLQVYAIRYLSAANRRQGNTNTATGQTLFEIYNSSNDAVVKREILNNLAGMKDSDHVLQIARNEKNHDMQMEALRHLGGMNSQPAAAEGLVAIYGSSQDKDTRREIINILAGERNAKALVDLGRKEKDLEMKKFIVERVVSMNTPESKQFLEEILK